MLDCSVIVRAYNEGSHLGRLFEGIRCQTLQGIEVVLVDSGSTDDTVLIGEKNGARIVHIHPDDFSFGRSLNLGIEQSHSRYLVICSAHVYPVYPDWLERLIRPLEDKKTALTYGKQRGSAASHFSEQQIFRSWYPDGTAGRQSHPFCNNANAAVKRELWEKHPYNENLPALEDLAWARWAHDQGYAIRYISEAEVIHVHSESWSGIANRYRREAIAFKQIYPRETFSLLDMLGMYVRNVHNDLGYAKEKGITIPAGDIRRFRWAQSYGTYQGYHQSGPLTRKLKQTFYYPRSLSEKDDPDASRDIEPIQYG